METFFRLKLSKVVSLSLRQVSLTAQPQATCVFRILDALSERSFWVSASMPPVLSDHRTDLQLVEAINGGDISAFDVLYDRHRNWVMRLAMRFTGHHEDALDVLQETFSYLVRKFPGFQLSAALTTFLYPAVRNYSLAVRRRRLRSSGGQEELPLIVDPVLTPSEGRDEISLALATLSDSHREILLMRSVDEMTQPEIAAALELPLGTVKSRLHHAILAARQLPCFAEHRSDTDESV